MGICPLVRVVRERHAHRYHGADLGICDGEAGPYHRAIADGGEEVRLGLIRMVCGVGAESSPLVGDHRVVETGNTVTIGTSQYNASVSGRHPGRRS